MNAYAPPTDAGLALLVAAIVVPAALSLRLLRSPPGAWMRLVAWTLLVAALVAGPLATAGDAVGTRMLLLCAAIFFAMKLVVTAEARLAGRPVPTALRHLAFHFLWPGMRPWAFATPHDARAGSARLVAEGLVTIVVGVLLLVTARAAGADGPRIALSVPLAIAGALLVAHFGLFRALAGLWRARGVAVVPIMDAPQRSQSLAEFWSRRWNRAFSEMAQVAVHRPLVAPFGPTVATVAVFVFSGLLHEMALSVPARGGYGLPSLYFAIHGALVLLEPRLGFGPGGRRVRWGTAWTVAAVLLPTPLLFHRPFLDACILPLLDR